MAHTLGTRALRLFRVHEGREHPDVGNTLDLLGRVRRAQGNLRAAVQLHRRAVAVLALHRRFNAVRPMYQQALTHLGGALRDAGRYPEARTVLARAVALGTRQGTLAEIAARNEFGMLCKYAGWYADGAQAYAQALALAECDATTDPMMLATLLHNLGGLEHARERPDAALGPARRGLAVRMAAVGSDHPAVAADQGALAAILADLGSYAEAEAIYRTLLAHAVKRRDAAEQAVLCHNLGALLARTERLQEALPVIRRAVDLGRRVLGVRHPDMALTLHNLGAVLAGLGRTAAARRALREAERVGRHALGPRHPTTVASRQALLDLA